ncbi:alpha/beta hydrolase [Spiribacter vilamensis]|uniref:Serine aminopeptidase S33 family n=1 Tax=Spiribacter vilamensis TaxID=531306 RepID=A0A4Q8D263_9GAMM|nr:alpha/beta fold hydrolase [Spiribacter vilamensis]RZU99377.1 serine aminopeptidase S33 family [Spiribacter vilamensis]
MTMLVWTGAVLLVLAALAWAATRWLRHSLAAPRRPVEGSPADHGVSGIAVSFPTRRGRWLSGWLLDGDPRIGRVVICHGWGVNRLFMLSLARPLQRAGWQVLLFDVRNHGNSDADDFSSMPRFAEDIVAAVAWLRRNDDGDEGPLIIAGHSVGAAATLLAAAWRDDVDGVISLSGFVHPERMMKRWLAARHVPFIPFGWLVLRYVEAVIGHRFATIAPVSVIGRIRVPVLIAHGRRDRVIPPVDAEALARAGDPGTTTLVWLEGDHDLSDELAEQWPRLVAFLDAVADGIASRKDRGHD